MIYIKIYGCISIIFFCLLYYYNLTIVENNKDLSIDYLQLAINSLIFPITLIRMLIAFINVKASKQNLNAENIEIIEDSSIPLFVSIQYTQDNIDAVRCFIHPYQIDDIKYELDLDTKEFEVVGFKFDKNRICNINDWLVKYNNEIHVYCDEDFKVRFHEFFKSNGK